MAQNYNEEFPQFPESMCFVGNLVRYVVQFRDEPSAPSFETGPSRFTSNIGKAVLKLIRCHYDENLEKQILEVIATCLPVPPNNVDKELVHKTSFTFLRQYFDLLLSNTSADYFHFFVIICNLCLEFSAAGMADCINTIVPFLQGLLCGAMYNPDMYKTLDMHAKNILNANGRA